MTATDPRPALAAMLAEKLAPAARALAEAYADDMIAGPLPEDDRACAEYHRAGRARLAHLRQLLGVLDWAAARMPEPEPAEEPAYGPDEARDEPRPYVCDYDGSRETPEFRARLADVERRAGPIPKDPDHPDHPLSCMIGERLFIGDLASPEYREWREWQNRRDREELERWLDGDDPDDDAGGAPRAEPITPPAPAERHAPNPAA